MKCAYSFQSMLCLVVAVVIGAVIVLYATNDICPNTSLRCDVESGEGKCLPKRRICDGVFDCKNGSDEVDYRCADLAGVGAIIDQHLKIPNNLAETQLPRSLNRTVAIKLPPGCKAYGGTGTLCQYLNWTSIPWTAFDKFSSTKYQLNRVLTTEKLAKTNNTPNLFALKVMYLENNAITVLGDGSLCHLKSITWMHLPNNSIERIGLQAFCTLRELMWLDLSNNKLNLKYFRFLGMPKLDILMLANNQITELSDHVFRDLHNLGFLNLTGNVITHIGERTFRYNMKLRDLDLSSNRIRQFEPLTFAGQKELLSLNIGFNDFRRLPENIFENLEELVSLRLEGIEISIIDLALFDKTPKLDFVVFNRFQDCRYVPKASRCYPISDGMSSIEDLLVDQTLRFVIWIVSALTVIGNITILCTRAGRIRKKVTVIDILVNNLAAADFLMGIYLLTIAVKDIEYRNSYNMHAYEWSTSVWCTIVGILATVSSEVSLIILSLMSVERYVAIRKPFAMQYLLSRTQARMGVGIIWTLVIVLALVPVFQWNGGNSYYGSTGVCFPMHLDDAFALGWEYTALVFLILNTVCLGTITVAYGIVFFGMQRRDRIRPANPAALKDMEVAVRLFVTVFTDFVCWAPIIVLKIMVLCGYQLPKVVILWVLIFVLPLNSAINPFLYTFSTSEVRGKVFHYFVKVPPPITATVEEKHERTSRPSTSTTITSL